jgi:hypothetical protein
VCGLHEMFSLKSLNAKELCFGPNVQVIDDDVLVDYKQSLYCDILTPLKICSFRHIYDRILLVSFEENGSNNKRDAHCIDRAKTEEMLKCGIGCPSE